MGSEGAEESYLSRFCASQKRHSICPFKFQFRQLISHTTSLSSLPVDIRPKDDGCSCRMTTRDKATPGSELASRTKHWHRLAKAIGQILNPQE